MSKIARLSKMYSFCIVIVMLIITLGNSVFAAKLPDKTGTLDDEMNSNITYTLKDTNSNGLYDYVEFGGTGQIYLDYIHFSQIESCVDVYVGGRISTLSKTWDYDGLMKKIRSIRLGNSVTSIGRQAFQWYPNLSSIEIPDSVTSIGGNAFDGCTGLTSIDIPDSVTSIGERAFSGCTGLTSVEIPNSVKVIESRTFSGCTSLTSIDIPDSVTSIGDDAFSGCTGLSSIEIPNSVTSIEDSAFGSCTGLTSIVIPNSVTSIGNYAFSYCSGLASIEIPDSATSIGERAFYGCTSLTSVEIPNSVSKLETDLFNGCTNLRTVTLPDSITKIESSAFEGCTNLTTVYVPCKDFTWFDYNLPRGVAVASHKEKEIGYLAPSGITNGHTAGVICEYCGVTISGNEVIEPGAHTIVIDQAVDPTCTTTGLTEGSHCSDCGLVFQPQNRIPALGHKIVVIPAVAPTYNSTGLTAGTYCSTCGLVLSNQQVVPKLTPATPDQPSQPSTPSTPTTPSMPARPTQVPSNPPTPSTPAGEQSESGVAGFVERLYTIALGRKSDPNGKAAWINAIKNGESGAEAAKGFLFSDEFLNKPLSNEEFVKILYKTFFDREADQGGLNAWVAALGRGDSKQDVIMGFINSTEWANVCLKYGIASGGTGSPNIEVEPNENIIAFATRLYTTCLKRTPDQNGLMAWARQLANLRDTGSNAAHGFFFSDEMNNNPVSNEEFVTRLYLTFMDRQPDQGGMNAWVGQLDAGVSREEVFQGFAQSSEFGAICANYGIIR